MSGPAEIAAAGLRFPAIVDGDGPLALLLHGFPDGPETWAAQLPVLAAAGYRAVAVTGRGYARECRPADGDYHVETLARDVLAVLDALGAERAHLVGHDWGATVAYAVAALAPDRLLSLTTVGVPHPGRMFAVAAGDPEQLDLYDYTRFFLAPDAAAAVAAEDLAYLEMLWSRWSPGWDIPAAALAAMRARMSVPDVLASALQYYVQATDAGTAIGQRSLSLLTAPVPVATLGIAGTDDRCNLLRTMRAALVDEDFPAGVKLIEIADAGHFPHRERPQAFNAALLNWLCGHSKTA